MSEHVKTLEAIRSAFDGIPKPCAERDALDAAIAALAHPQPVTPAGGEVARDAYSRIIKALAAIVNVSTPDELFELDAIPRDPVMAEVMRIKAAADDQLRLTHPPVADAALVVTDEIAIRALQVYARQTGRVEWPDGNIEAMRAAIDAALNQRGGGDHG